MLILGDRGMITLPQLARLCPFGVHPWRRWLRDGQLPGAVKEGSRWLIPVESVDLLLLKVPKKELQQLALKAATKAEARQEAAR